jgi:double-stranded uracil-DNA glycosylase
MQEVEDMGNTGFRRFIHHNMIVLFVPLNPAKKSWDKKHYFSSFPSTRKSSLWYQLYHAKFAAELYDELEADVKVFGNTENRLGIIDLIDKVTSNPGELTKQDIERGRSRLKSEINHYKPKIVCFLGKGTYRKFKSIGNSTTVRYGSQDEFVGQTEIFVAPFPSSMSMDVEEKIEILKRLHNLYSRCEH